MPRDPRWRTLITPPAIFAAVAVAGSLVAIFYGARVDRSDTQLPILVAGFLVLGLTLLALAVGGGMAVLRFGRVADTRGAFLAALFGGICALGAAGTIGAAIILALIWTSAPRPV